MTYDRESAAAGTLADGRANSAEGIGVGGSLGGCQVQKMLAQGRESRDKCGERTLAAVEVHKTENVGSTALGRAVDAAAGDVGHLARLDLLGREGRDEASEDGSGDGESELHFGGLI